MGGSVATHASQTLSDQSLMFSDRLRKDHRFAQQVAINLDPDTLMKMEMVAQMSVPKDGTAARPSNGQIAQHSIRMAVPFFGFGVFDNVVMITVGDAIDATFGVTLGFSTLTAAAMGQMASDSCGLTLQSFIERFADTLGLPNPDLSRAQERLSIVQNVTQISRTFGIVFGCFVGMFPLLFLGGDRPRLTQKLLDLLPSAKAKELLAAMETKEFDEGQQILAKGMSNEYLYLITSGEVEVFGRDKHGETILACTLQTGEVFGELEFLQGNNCVADVVASTFLRTKVLSRDEFLRIVGEDGKSKLISLINNDISMDVRYMYHNMKAETSGRLHSDNPVMRTLSRFV